MEKSNHYSFFQNRECEYFPCHQTEHPEQFNCMFCYCPLYMLEKNCGGNFQITASGVKDCSNCLLPHGRGGYDYINGKLREYIAVTKEKYRQENAEKS